MDRQAHFSSRLTVPLLFREFGDEKTLKTYERRGGGREELEAKKELNMFCAGFGRKVTSRELYVCNFLLL